MDVYIKVVATSAGVLAEETFLVSFCNGLFKLETFEPELSSHVNVCSLGAHRETNAESALDKLVGVVSQDLSVLAGTWLKRPLAGSDSSALMTRYEGLPSLTLGINEYFRPVSRPASQMGNLHHLFL